LETVKTQVGICHKIGPFPHINGSETSACVYDDGGYLRGGRDEQLADNARLIAAAPEMYEALEEAQRRLSHAEGRLLEIDYIQNDSVPSNQDILPGIQAAWGKVHAALAKARGEKREVPLEPKAA
jgi:hypothetical protein